MISASVTVTAYNVEPEVSIEASAESIDEGDSVIFTGSFSDPGFLDTHEALWDFGDGTTATGYFIPGVGYTDHEMEPIEHTYGDDGEYIVTLLVTDDDEAIGDAQTTITVNNVAPGYTRTERLEELAADLAKRGGTSPQDVVREWEESIPMNRLGKPEELGRVIAFLASDAASYVTGVTVQVDGGSVLSLL